MKKTFVILLAVCALALTTTAALAAESKLPAFEELDVDHSGSISAKEASPCEALMNCFVKADIDQDGQLTLAEYASVEAGKDQKK
jgi:EF hand